MSFQGPLENVLDTLSTREEGLWLNDFQLTYDLFTTNSFMYHPTYDQSRLIFFQVQVLLKEVNKLFKGETLTIILPIFGVYIRLPINVKRMGDGALFKL